MTQEPTTLNFHIWVNGEHSTGKTHLCTRFVEDSHGNDEVPSDRIHEKLLRLPENFVINLFVHDLGETKTYTQLRELFQDHNALVLVYNTEKSFEPVEQFLSLLQEQRSENPLQNDVVIALVGNHYQAEDIQGLSLAGSAFASKYDGKFFRLSESTPNHDIFKCFYETTHQMLKDYLQKHHPELGDDSLTKIDEYFRDQLSLVEETKKSKRPNLTLDILDSNKAATMPGNASPFGAASNLFMNFFQNSSNTRLNEDPILRPLTSRKFLSNQNILDNDRRLNPIDPTRPHTARATKKSSQKEKMSFSDLDLERLTKAQEKDQESTTPIKEEDDMEDTRETENETESERKVTIAVTPVVEEKHEEEDQKKEEPIQDESMSGNAILQASLTQLRNEEALRESREEEMRMKAKKSIRKRAKTASEKQKPPRLEAWIKKRSSAFLKGYENKWCVLDNRKIYYYNTEKDVQYHGVLNFDQHYYSIQFKRGHPVPLDNEEKFKGELLTYMGSNNIKFILATANNANIFRFRPATLPVLKEWVLGVRKHILESEGYRRKLEAPKKQKFWRFDTISSKQIEHFSTTGDILLFRTANTASRAQRLVSNSQYDHVAIIIRMTAYAYIYEVNLQEGVNLTKWDDFVEKRWYSAYQKVMYRKLNMERPQELMDEVSAYAVNHCGDKYAISASKLVKRHESLDKKDDAEGYFCSELVGAVYRIMGILDETKSVSEYWPVDFAADKKLKLKDAALGPEIQVDFL